VPSVELRVKASVSGGSSFGSKTTHRMASSIDSSTVKKIRRTLTWLRCRDRGCRATQDRPVEFGGSGRV
jgi:hypothetical protein